MIHIGQIVHGEIVHGGLGGDLAQAMGGEQAKILSVSFLKDFHLTVVTETRLERTSRFGLESHFFRCASYMV